MEFAPLLPHSSSSLPSSAALTSSSVGSWSSSSLSSIAAPQIATLPSTSGIGVAGVSVVASNNGGNGTGNGSVRLTPLRSGIPLAPLVSSSPSTPPLSSLLPGRTNSSPSPPSSHYPFGSPNNNGTAIAATTGGAATPFSLPFSSPVGHGDDRPANANVNILSPIVTRQPSSAIASNHTGPDEISTPIPMPPLNTALDRVLSPPRPQTLNNTIKPSTSSIPSLPPLTINGNGSTIHNGAATLSPPMTSPPQRGQGNGHGKRSSFRRKGSIHRQGSSQMAVMRNVTDRSDDGHGVTRQDTNGLEGDSGKLTPSGSARKGDDWFADDILGDLRDEESPPMCPALHRCYHRLAANRSSLFIFSPRSSWRIMAAASVRSKWFEYGVLLVILVNCIILAMSDPLTDSDDDFQNTAERVFTSLYTVEIVIKVVAYGFAFHPDAYLRQVWNVMDFCVVLAGWATLLPQFGASISAIRTLRFLRPLRSIPATPGLRMVISTLAISLPGLRDVFGLFAFFFTFFGLLGLHLFNGVLYQRCMFDNSTRVVDPDGDLCSRGTYGRHCQDGQYCGVSDENPSLIESFDNFGLSMLNVFQVVTQEGWTTILYDVTNSTSLWAAFFFIFLLILGAMLGLNLIIAILHDSYYFSDKSRTAANEAASRTTTINRAPTTIATTGTGGDGAPGSPPMMGKKSASIAPAPSRLPTTDLGALVAAQSDNGNIMPSSTDVAAASAAADQHVANTLEVPAGWDPNFPGHRRDSVILPPPYVSRMAASPRDSILAGQRNLSQSMSPTDWDTHGGSSTGGSSGHHVPHQPSVSSPLIMTGKGVFKWPRQQPAKKEADTVERQSSATGTAAIAPTIAMPPATTAPTATTSPINTTVPMDDQSRPPSPNRVSSMVPPGSVKPFVINITPAHDTIPLPPTPIAITTNDGDSPTATDPLLPSNATSSSSPTDTSVTSSLDGSPMTTSMLPERKTMRSSYAEQRHRALSDVEEADLETRSPPSERVSSRSASQQHSPSGAMSGTMSGQNKFEIDDTLTESQRHRSEQGIRRLFGVESISIKRGTGTGTSGPSLLEPGRRDSRTSRRSLPSTHTHSPPSAAHGRSISTNPSAPVMAASVPLSAASTSVASAPAVTAPLPPPPEPPLPPAPSVPSDAPASSQLTATSVPLPSSSSSDTLTVPGTVAPLSTKETEHKRRTSLIRMYASDTDLLHSSSPPRVDYYTGQVTPALPSPVASLTTQARALSPAHVTHIDASSTRMAPQPQRPVGRLINSANGKLVFGAALSARYERELRRQRDAEQQHQAELERQRRLAKTMSANDSSNDGTSTDTTLSPPVSARATGEPPLERAETLRANRRGVLRTDRRKGSGEFPAASTGAVMRTTSKELKASGSLNDLGGINPRRASNLKSHESNESTASKDSNTAAVPSAVATPLTGSGVLVTPPILLAPKEPGALPSPTPGAIVAKEFPKGSTLSVPGHAHGSVPSSARNSLVPPMNLAHLVIPDSRHASFSQPPSQPTISSTITAGELALQQALDQQGTEMTASGRVRFLSADKDKTGNGGTGTPAEIQARRVSQNEIASWKGVSSQTARRQSTVGAGVLTPRRKIWTISELRRVVREVVNHRYWQMALLLGIVINTLLMASDHVGIDPTVGSNLELASVYFTYIFAAEIVISVFGNGARFFAEAMNVFDCFIIAVNLIEIGLRGTSSLSAFRAIRLLHIFRLGEFTRLNKLANRLQRALLACRANFFVFMLFNFIFTLMGMSFFGAQMRDPVTGVSYRYNFDTFAIAFVTTFQLTTTENWPDVMTAAIQGSGYLACIYFIVLICICTYILLTLFLAILLSFFGELTPTDKKIAKMRWRLSIRRIIAKQRDERRSSDTKKKQKALKAQLMEEIRAKSTPIQPMRRGHTSHNLHRLSTGLGRSGSATKQLPLMVVVSPSNGKDTIIANPPTSSAGSNTPPNVTGAATTERNHRRSLTTARKGSSGGLWSSGDHTRAHRVSNMNSVQERFRAEHGGTATGTVASGGDGSNSDGDSPTTLATRRASGSLNTKRLSGRQPIGTHVAPLPSLIRSMSQQPPTSKEQKQTDKVIEVAIEVHAEEMKKAEEKEMKQKEKRASGGKQDDATATATVPVGLPPLATTSSDSLPAVPSPRHAAAAAHVAHALGGSGHGASSSHNAPVPSPRHISSLAGSSPSGASSSSLSSSHVHHRTRSGHVMDFADITERAQLRAATDMRHAARVEDEKRLHHGWQRPLHTLPVTATELAGPATPADITLPPRPQDGLMGVLRAAMGHNAPPQPGVTDNGMLMPLPSSLSSDSLLSDRPSSPRSISHGSHTSSAAAPLKSTSSSMLIPSLSAPSSLDPTETKRMLLDRKDSHHGGASAMMMPSLIESPAAVLHYSADATATAAATRRSSQQHDPLVTASMQSRRHSSMMEPEAIDVIAASSSLPLPARRPSNATIPESAVITAPMVSLASEPTPVIPSEPAAPAAESSTLSSHRRYNSVDIHHMHTLPPPGAWNPDVTMTPSIDEAAEHQHNDDDDGDNKDNHNSTNEPVPSTMASQVNPSTPVRVAPASGRSSPVPFAPLSSSGRSSPVLSIHTGASPQLQSSQSDNNGTASFRTRPFVLGSAPGVSITSIAPLLPAITGDGTTSLRGNLLASPVPTTPNGGNGNGGLLSNSDGTGSLRGGALVLTPRTHRASRISMDMRGIAANAFAPDSNEPLSAGGNGGSASAAGTSSVSSSTASGRALFRGVHTTPNRAPLPPPPVPPVAPAPPGEESSTVSSSVDSSLAAGSLSPPSAYGHGHGSEITSSSSSLAPSTVPAKLAASPMIRPMQPLGALTPVRAMPLTAARLAPVKAVGVRRPPQAPTPQSPPSAVSTTVSPSTPAPTAATNNAVVLSPPSAYTESLHANNDDAPISPDAVGRGRTLDAAAVSAALAAVSDNTPPSSPPLRALAIISTPPRSPPRSPPGGGGHGNGNTGTGSTGSSPSGAMDGHGTFTGTTPPSSGRLAPLVNGGRLAPISTPKLAPLRRGSRPDAPGFVPFAPLPPLSSAFAPLSPPHALPSSTNNSPVGAASIPPRELNASSSTGSIGSNNGTTQQTVTTTTRHSPSSSLTPPTVVTTTTTTTTITHPSPTHRGRSSSTGSNASMSAAAAMAAAATAAAVATAAGGNNNNSNNGNDGTMSGSGSVTNISINNTIHIFTSPSGAAATEPDTATSSIVNAATAAASTATSSSMSVPPGTTRVPSLPDAAPVAGPSSLSSAPPPLTIPPITDDGQTIVHHHDGVSASASAHHPFRRSISNVRELTTSLAPLPNLRRPSLVKAGTSHDLTRFMKQGGNDVATSAAQSPTAAAVTAAGITPSSRKEGFLSVGFVDSKQQQRKKRNMRGVTAPSPSPRNSHMSAANLLDSRHGTNAMALLEHSEHPDSQSESMSEKRPPLRDPLRHLEVNDKMMRSATQSKLERRMREHEEFPIPIWRLQMQKWLRRRHTIQVAGGWVWGFKIHIDADHFSLFMATLTTILLFFEDPKDGTTDDAATRTQLAVRSLDWIVVFVFIMEAAFKIVAYGAWKKPPSIMMKKKDEVLGYFNDNWNTLDFLITIATFAYSLNLSFGIFRTKNLHALQAARPLRLVRWFQGLKQTVSALVQSLPAAIGVVVLAGTIIFIFGLIGLKFFKGRFSYCEPDASLDRTQCIGNITSLAPDGSIQSVTLRRWRNPPYHFDNIGMAILTMYQVATVEQWPIIMYHGMDVTSVDSAPVRDNSYYYAFFFVVFLALSQYVMFNLFTGVIVDNFNATKASFISRTPLTHEQRKWVSLHEELLQVPVPKKLARPDNFIRARVFDAVTSKWFGRFMTLVIMANTITLTLTYNNMPEHWGHRLDIASLVFTIIYAGEVVVKWIALARLYWHDSWNVFDFCVTIVCVIAEALYWSFPIDNSIQILRIARVLRLFQLVPQFDSLYNLLRILYFSIPQFLWAIVLLLMVFYVYARAGMSLFGDVKFGDFLNENANYRSVISAMLLHFRMTTGENWNGIMNDCMVQPPFCSGTDCGTWFAIPFFLSFNILGIIMMGMFVAVILDNFKVVQREQDGLSRTHLIQFCHLWRELASRDRPGLMHVRKLGHMMIHLQPPWGPADWRQFQPLFMARFITRLKLQCNKDGEVMFHEALFAIVRNQHGVALPEDIAERLAARHNQALADLHRERFEENSFETLAAQHYYAIILQRGFRMKRDRKRKERRKRAAADRAVRKQRTQRDLLEKARALLGSQASDPNGGAAVLAAAQAAQREEGNGSNDGPGSPPLRKNSGKNGTHGFLDRFRRPAKASQQISEEQARAAALDHSLPVKTPKGKPPAPHFT